LGPLAKRQPPVVGHAYVGNVSGALERYPIVNGVVSSKADSILFVSNYGLSAIAPDGTAYVTTFTGWQVAVYAPGASGNAQPIRTLNLGAHAGALTVDPFGYLYVVIYPVPGKIDMFAPGAAGNASPVSTIANEAPGAMAVGADGNLYMSSYQGVHVYATPLTQPVLTRSMCVAELVGNLALSTKGMYLTASDHGVGEIEAFKRTANGCPPPRHASIYGQLRFPDGVAVHDEMLLVTDGNSAYQYDADRFGKQVPLVVIPQHPNFYPRDLHFGP
jgi:hypothetical protein